MRAFASTLERLAPAALAKRAILVPVAVYLFALSGFLGDSYSRFDFPLDDAWIHRVYSRSIAFGHGFAYNEGEQEAGSTSPLWAVVTAPAHWLEGAGEETVAAAVKLIGVLLGLATLAAVVRIGTRVGGSTLAGLIGATLFALEPRFLFSSLAGMENILLIALWAWACDALLGGRFLLSVILLSLAPVTRPEAVVLLPLCLPALVQLSRRRGWSLATFAAWIIPVVPFLLWMAFCKTTTGHFLPNTYYLKTRPFEFGSAEVAIAWRAIFSSGLTSWWAFVAGLAACVSACLTVGRSRGALRVLLLTAPPVAYLVAVTGSRTIVFDGYYWTRWLDPACIMMIIPFCVGFGVLIARLVRRRDAVHQGELAARENRRLEVLVGVAAIVVLATSFPSYQHSYIDRRDHLSTDSRAIHILNVQTGKWIAEHTPETSVVAVNDAGAIRYFGKRRTIDLMGLNARRIAFGEIERQQAIMDADWLAVFPGWFHGTPEMTAIAAGFEPRKEIRIPFEEYTICKDPSQTVIVVFERRRPGRAP